jgi:hypothetical protein
MLAVFHTIHSRAKKEKRTKKERMLLLLLLKLILNSIGVTIRGQGPPESALQLISSHLSSEGGEFSCPREQELIQGEE